jgi:hypothetical protein
MKQYMFKIRSTSTTVIVFANNIKEAVVKLPAIRHLEWLKSGMEYKEEDAEEVIRRCLLVG